MKCYCCEKDGLFLRQIGNIKYPLCPKHYRIVHRIAGWVAGQEDLVRALDSMAKENDAPKGEK